ncbi:MAG TPA: methylated-DNA--[protein]-cysteine S-methyltransferase [Sedimentibacter sp.]|jgi:methylated-DNA-[protein]-cysteine S-methyltransferase|nr:methylated-DNA--[protein]-cysteine S-methyltransferase [Sedimentibacter sp.]HNZ82933.1 methylated-DNA--[protein]-cysteine S-methyltransferase [Sedimentibacter sp.]HOH69908.1 methylated-DNA--[protein]-cysteine S-methyltransferase [Sedimentibacter sp.]
MKSIFYYDTDIGKISIAENDGFITHVLFGNEKLNDIPVEETPLIKEAHKQIEEYLKGQRSLFDLPLAPSGTEFQKRVWNALKNIPYGKTVSYKDIAIEAGNEKASRAVGMANNKNPISIIIPCHRVIGQNGKLVGYGGGIEIKEYLLRLEKENS